MREFSVLRELKLTAGKMLRQKAVKDRAMRIDAEQQAALSRSQRDVKNYERQAPLRSNTVFSEENGGDK